MPDNPISGLYPQPSQHSTGGLLSGDPMQAINALANITALQRAQQELKARNAIGQAYQQNIGPEGLPDLAATGRAIKANPDAAYGAPEATTNLLGQRQQMIQNGTSSFEQYAKQNDFAMQGLAALASKGKKVSPEDVYNWAATMSRNSDPRAVPSTVLSGLVNGLLRDPSGLPSALQDLQNRVAGAGTAMQRIPGPPGPAGQPQTIPLGAAGGLGGAVPTGQAPGEQAVQEGAAGRSEKLMSTASTTAQYHADLDNLKQDSKILDNLGGPTVEVEKKLNQLSQRVGGFGVTMDKDQLRALESFDKIANQVSLNQSTMFHGSDAGLHTVVGANPSSGMSRYGRDGVIDMLHGNQDAIDTTRKLWLDARANGTPANSYDVFMHGVGRVIDPRVFQFNRLSRDNQQKFLSNMDPDDLPGFESRYSDSVKRGWVKPLKPKPKDQ